LQLSADVGHFAVHRLLEAGSGRLRVSSMSPQHRRFGLKAQPEHFSSSHFENSIHHPMGRAYHMVAVRCIWRLAFFFKNTLVNCAIQAAVQDSAGYKINSKP
jgi:hypothetical protein